MFAHIPNYSANKQPESNTTTIQPPFSEAIQAAYAFDSEALVQQLGVGIIKYDAKGSIIIANNAASEMLGLSEDEMTGKTAFNPEWNVVHEDGTSFTLEQYPIARAITTQRSVNNVVMGVYRPKSKDRVWLLVNAEPQFDGFGLFLHVLVTFTNITAYKNLQDELRIKNQILESISANSLDIIGIMDVTGQYHYVSEAAMVISGYSQEELLGVNALDIAPKKTKEYIRQLLQSLPFVGKIENMLGKIICKDGSVKYISWSFQWDGNAKLIYVNGRDKTQEVKNSREAEAKSIADEQQKRHLIFEAADLKLKNISYELHENVGQIIATVKMYLDQLSKTESNHILQESKDLLSVCINELRTITYVNSTPKFEEVGFANAIEILMQLQFKKQEVIHAVHFSVAETSIATINRINIYRLLQLWLSHIASREKLISVIVDISENTETLLLTITDEVAIAINHTDYLSPDLMPIKERLNIIGGSMSLKPSADKKCFTITFSLKKEMA